MTSSQTNVADKRVPELLGRLIGTNFLLLVANEKPVSTLELQRRCATLLHLRWLTFHFGVFQPNCCSTQHTDVPPPHSPHPFPVFQTSESCRACDSVACDFSRIGRLPLTCRARSDSGGRLPERGNRALQSFRPAASPHAELRCNLVHLFRYLGHRCNSRSP